MKRFFSVEECLVVSEVKSVCLGSFVEVVPSVVGIDETEIGVGSSVDIVLGGLPALGFF